MKTTRRKFFGLMGAAPVAAALASKTKEAPELEPVVKYSTGEFNMACSMTILDQISYLDNDIVEDDEWLP